MDTTPADLLKSGQAFCLITLIVRKEIILIVNLRTFGFGKIWGIAEYVKVHLLVP
jgi:hypothetical protein